MREILKSLLLILVFTLNCESTVKQISESDNNGRVSNIVTEGPEQSNQVFSKVLEGLVPSSMKFLVKNILGNLDSKRIFKSVASYVIPTASHNNTISQQCREDSWLYVESLTNFTDWALKMFDATGKIPEGILSGNYHSDGHFDQCLRVKGPEDLSGPKFTGKYCTVFLRPRPVPAGQSINFPSKSKFKSLPVMDALRNIDFKLLEMVSLGNLIRQLPSLAFCLPSSCSAKDVEFGLANIMASTGVPDINGLKIVPFTNENFCTVVDSQRDFDLMIVVVMVVFGILGLLLVLGTGYEVFLRQRDKEDLQGKYRMLLNFSILTNGAKILETSYSTEGAVGCLHGIRAISCFWVILCHTFSGGLNTPNANVVQAKEDGILWSSQVVVNGTLSVDSFLFLSGLLVTYLTLRELDATKGKLNISLMYISRYLRLTPLCVFLIAFLATVMVHLGSGPYWGQMELQAEACRKFWWYYLLYINNFFYDSADVGDCLGHAWYLALDMQLFMLSPIFIYALWHKPKLGITLLGVALLGFTALTMFIIYSKNLPPTFLAIGTPDPKTLLEFYNVYYQIPWCRVMPYLVGIFMGYVLHSTRNTKITMKSWLVATGWAVATGIGLSALFGMHKYVDSTKVLVIPRAVSVLYGSLHRTAWAVSLSWLVFACVHGYGVLVNKFLCWSVFIPLSRITYCAYLVHVKWIDYYNARSRTVDYYTASDTIIRFSYNLVVSFGLAFIAAVCVEAPFANLQKLLVSGRSENSLDFCVLFRTFLLHRETPGRSIRKQFQSERQMRLIYFALYTSCRKLLYGYSWMF